MESPVTKRCHPNERFCLHCSQIVAYKTYRAHKRFFYNPTTGLWFTNEAPSEALQEKSLVDDDDLPPASSEESNIDDFYGESPPCSNPAFSESESLFSDDNSSQQFDQGG